MRSAIDTTRRRFLAQAAAVTAGGAALGAALPLPASAGATEQTPDPILAAIEAWRAADEAHDNACGELNDAEVRYDVGSDEAEDAFERGGPACHASYEAGWELARIQPTTLAGVLAVLRLANEIEDGRMELPNSDTVGREGWHYQFRATIAASIDTIIRRGA